MVSRSQPMSADMCGKNCAAITTCICAENTKLKAQVESTTDRGDQYFAEIQNLQARVAELEGALKELEFYETDPWARTKIRVALAGPVVGDGER